ncbi:MAG: bifunctional sulfur carrier protein/thiazole synthase protein [Planctomycetota bacterium]|jgi:sulfur carrier protein
MGTGHEPGGEVRLHVRVNGEVREFTGPLTVAGLLQQLGLADRPVAVECNKVLVRKAEHATTELADGDQLEVVTFFGGG